jgi:hypothetical protein
MTYSARISASHNKTKTTWNILNELLGKKTLSKRDTKTNS